MPLIDKPMAGPQAEVLAPWYKYNLTDINAAIALVQLNKLEHLNSRRAQIAREYQQALADTPFQPLSLPQWAHVHAAPVHHSR